MPLQAIDCNICGVYEPCYHACCMLIFVCPSCLMNTETLANYNECPKCYRSLQGVYHVLANQAMYDDDSGWHHQRPFPNKRPRTPQPNQNPIRNNFNFQDSRHEDEEEFEFAQTLEKKQSQVRRQANNFSSQSRNCSNPYQQDNFNQQGINNSFGPKNSFQQKMSPGNVPFSPRNNFGNGQFNGKRNNLFEDPSQYNQDPYNPNLGFNHNNEMYMNDNYNHQGHRYNSGNGNGGFTQNIRQSRSSNRNNGFQQNAFRNDFSGNGQFQNQQQVNFGAGNKKPNPFSMWNQQNQGNFNQNQFQGNNSFQSNNNNSFQNRQSYERTTKSVGKVHQLKRVNNFNGSSSSFKVDDHGNNSNSEKEHSPTFGGEFKNDQNFNGAVVPFRGQINGGREQMDIEEGDGQQMQGFKRTKSSGSLVTLGRKSDSNEF